MKYRKIPIVIEATQWHKNGDHPLDDVMRPFEDTRDNPCDHCSKIMNEHGWIDTLEGGHIVCPGDFVITGIKGERYPCKPDIFALTYESIDGEDIN